MSQKLRPVRTPQARAPRGRDTRTPTLINLACFWILQIPLAYWLAETMAWGPDGVFLAIVAAETLLTALGILAFRRGRWKSRHA